MALLLHIDTATESAGIYLSENNQLIASEQNHEQKNHASFIQPAIQKILQQQNKSLHNIDAVSVVNGPGSYTGLRVGLASAKGICYALNKPLITLNTLHIMAYTIHHNIQHILPENNHSTPILYCPMIDARRMEVYCALYNQHLQEVFKPTALIIHEQTFSEELNQHYIVFSGNGHDKFKHICTHPHAIYSAITYTQNSIIALAEEDFNKKQFANLPYSQPFYLKEVYIPSKQNI
ncbi:MAG: tRNA (adenosine(37)-N6)-threonylcarbamoyltransferase complex dimerization subunit type 1 TsaB [Chitinophagaceae bacterium]|nr:tRNA (adenosine(37)-N6)-threonylcarbamoyltransferase complex dimerization subunit type 1 TsaB [Chitinophagaceae bacterium]MCW5904418.1 tRNA (adenosine(37)-N6)-threonylcarbamoyltransferase complex dimerization subunit type 1 TsaB [Chitinophagaceae bacterium]